VFKTNGDEFKVQTSAAAPEMPQQLKSGFTPAASPRGFLQCIAEFGETTLQRGILHGIDKQSFCRQVFPERESTHDLQLLKKFAYV
jgi:hypothetical protein